MPPAIFDVARCRVPSKRNATTRLTTRMLSLFRLPAVRCATNRVAARSIVASWRPEGCCGHDARARHASTQGGAAKASARRETPALAGLPSREECMKRLRAGEEFDLLVIGGGSTGAGAALDAATRGLNVACVEREDFSSGTSSRSTKLIWAGSRYLVQALVNLFSPAFLKAPRETLKKFMGDFHMVMGAHRERKFLLDTQPHLTRWLPIAVPLDKWLLWPPPFSYPPAALGPLGMFPLFFKFYDSLCKFTCPSSYILSASRAARAFPQLDKGRIKYCQVFYEGQHNDARTNLAIALTSVKHGAATCNYANVESLVHDDAGRVSGAMVRDLLDDGSSPFPVRAKQVLFCGGPFTDELRRMEDPDCEEAVNGAGGIHVVLPAYYCPRDMGLVDMATSDGRFLFFLPWQGHTIVGTTDHKTAPTMTPLAPEDEIQWVINEASKYLSPELHVRRSDVLSAWAGIRPLAVDPQASSTASASRDHVVSYNPKSGVVFLAGGKWTTYREMAEDGVDKCVEVGNLSPENGCKTLEVALLGKQGYHDNLHVDLIQQYGVNERVAKHLANTYGGRAHDVLRNARPTGIRFPKVGIPLVHGYPFIEAEIRYATREFARTAADVLARRTRLAFLNSNAARDATPRVVEIMAEELGWSKEYQAAEVERCMEYLTVFAGPEPNKAGAAIRAATEADLLEVFKSIDTDNSGCLSRAELLAASERLGFALTDAEMDQALLEMDTDESGSVDFKEFAAWWNSDSNNALLAEMRAEMAATPDKLKNATGVLFG